MTTDELGRGASPDDDARWISETLEVAARGYTVDVATVLDLIAAKGGPERAPVTARPVGAVPPAGGVVAPRRPHAVPGADPRQPARVRTRGRTALSVAASVALVLAGAAVADLARPDRDGGGVVQVTPAGPTPGPTGTAAATSPAPSVTAPPSVPPLPPATSTTSAPSPAATGTAARGGRLPAVLSWTDSGVVVAPRPDAARPLAGIKDPTVVVHDGRWHVFGTAIRPGGLGLVHLSFTDWSRAAAAPQDQLDLSSAIGPGYRAAPQVFWFAPQKLWYLVFQTGTNAAYSTNPDIDDPSGWSAPRTFYPGLPRTVGANLAGGNWVDMWVVCDATTCHLFSTDTKGRLFRSQTPIGDFPGGMSEPVVALREPSGNALLDGPAVYRVPGNGYLLLAEAIDTAGHRYLRSWRAATPAGPWTPRQAPFAASRSVTSAGSPWTLDLAQGELLRAGEDQTMTVSPCSLQLLVSGHAPGEPDPTMAWRIGLLRQKASTC